MHLSQGEVPENQTKPFPKMRLNALDYGVSPPAVGTFVVAILHHGNLRAVLALGVKFKVKPVATAPAGSNRHTPPGLSSVASELISAGVAVVSIFIAVLQNFSCWDQLMKSTIAGITS
jgi:hypothetical protein